MASVVGDAQDPDYQKGGRVTVGNTLGTSANRILSVQTRNATSTNLTVSRFLFAPTLVFGQCYSLSGGPITITTNTNIVSFPANQHLGLGYIVVYKADYSAMAMYNFYLVGASPGVQFANATSTTENNLVQKSGTNIDLSGNYVASPSQSFIRGTVTGSMDVYYKVFFHTNYLSAA